MKAVVLSCDRYRVLTDHMMRCYDRLWPDHPFRFRVPYQDLAPTQPPGRAEYRRTPSAIKATVLALLEDLPDREWIYWAIDDKYPIRLDVRWIERLRAWLDAPEAATVDGVLFCRCRSMWDPRALIGGRRTGPAGETMLERRAYEQIWVHQFARTRVLRHLFESLPDEIPYPRFMDPLKRELPKPPEHRLYVTRRNHAAFGESAERGTLTLNCRRSLRRHRLEPPAWCVATTPRRHLLGTRWQNLRLRLRHGLAGLAGRAGGHPAAD